MAVPLLIGNFKSKADYERKLSDQKKLLKLQTKLNKEADQASFEMQQMMEGVKPAAQPPRQVAEELQDYNLQRQNAIASADEKLTKADARAFVDTYLTTLDELVEFNRNAAGFLAEIENVDLVDARFMKTLYDRYMRQQYAGTSDLASLTTLQDEVDQVARDVLTMSEGGLTATDYAALEKAVEAASRRFDLKELKRLRRRAMGLPEREAQQARAAARISERARAPRPPRRPTIAQQRRETEARQRLTREAREARALEQLRQVEAEMGQRRALQQQRATESRLRRQAMLQREELPQEPTIEPAVRRRARPRPRPRR